MEPPSLTAPYLKFPSELSQVDAVLEELLCEIPRMRRRARLKLFFRGVALGIENGREGMLVLLALVLLGPGAALCYWLGFHPLLLVLPAVLELAAWCVVSFYRYGWLAPDAAAQQFFEVTWNPIRCQRFIELGDTGENLFPLDFHSVDQLEYDLRALKQRVQSQLPSMQA